MNNEPKFQIVTQELLETMYLKYYSSGKKLKEGDLIIPGFTIGYANINGHPPPNFYSHDDASSLNLNIFVWDKEKNSLSQLYSVVKK